MKFNCGKRTFERTRLLMRRRLKWWHPWFAWRPVRLGREDCRWLEYVQRRGTLFLRLRLESEYASSDEYWEWEYK